MPTALARPACLLATLAVAGCLGRGEPAVGYTYECRPGDGGRKILARVHAIEPYEGGRAVLVSIADGPGDPREPRIAFAAFDRNAFLRSCPQRAARAALRPDPRFNDTHRRWKAELAAGRSGVYEAPVARVVADFRALPVPPFVTDPGEPAAAGLLGPGPDAADYFVLPDE